MDFMNFLKYFSDFQVCYYHDGFKYSAIKLKSKSNKQIYLKVNITKPGTYYFSLNQTNSRFFEERMRYKYSPISQLIIHKDSNNSCTLIGSSMRKDKENWIKAQCRPGFYYIQISNYWKSFVDEYSYSIYGPQALKIDRVN